MRNSRAARSKRIRPVRRLGEPESIPLRNLTRPIELTTNPLDFASRQLGQSSLGNSLSPESPFGQPPTTPPKECFHRTMPLDLVLIQTPNGFMQRHSRREHGTTKGTKKSNTQDAGSCPHDPGVNRIRLSSHRDMGH
jgi:hypothetical protein